MAELRKSYSNFILRKKRQLTDKGSLYERDWMTVSEMDGFAPGTLPVYASGNFKMTINNERNGKKKYSFSNWLLNDSGSTDWNLDMIKEEELKVKNELIKPNYSSLLDFVYYGSGVELIRGTVNDLAKRFPAEIYTAGNKFVTGETESGLQYLTGVAENPFEIDIWTEYEKPERVGNPYRYMCLSYKKYEIIEYSGATEVIKSVEPVTAWTPGEKNREFDPRCPKNGDVVFTNAKINNITFKGIYYAGKIQLITATTGKHIRLQKKYLDEIYESFDDFERTLLNRDSKPMYKAKFYTPVETETGVITHERSYVWPTYSGKWNIDLESAMYESYLNGLLYIANYYDEIRTDNIWRSYTHETIKNFDWTTPKDTYIPEIDGHLIDTERMEAILRVCGRQFDDIKRYLENIKFTVNVSYDSKNNMPDDNLAKFLEMSGWEVKNVAPISNNDFIHDEDYPGKHVRVTAEDANKEFLKRLILNSRNILSKKGTRAGIEAVYSLFGLFDMRYGETMVYCGSPQPVGFTIEEYDRFANNYISGETGDSASTVAKIYALNKEKNGYTRQFENNFSDYAGLMTEEKFVIDNIRYLVPWYEIDYEYDGRPYYQMFGGWGKRNRKDIQLPELAPDIAEIFSDDMVGIYDETVKEIKVVEDLKTLNETPAGYLKEGDVYYVLSMQGAPNCSDDYSDSGYSHYVFFATAADAAVLFSGDTVAYDDEYVWCLVNKSEFEVTETSELSWYAKKIIYIESIHDSSIGNNPHTGRLKYDGGEEYFKYYEELFRGAFDNDLFTEYQGRVSSENARRNYENRFRENILEPVEDITSDTAITSVGFEVTSAITDNSKIWFFLSDDNGIYSSTPSDYSGSTLYSKLFESEGDFKKETNTDFPLQYERAGNEQSFYWNAPIWGTGSTFDFSGSTLDIPSEIRGYHGEGPDETWGYSVINTKNIKITYYLPWEMEDYVTNVVEFYVKQVIPSTAIVEFKWNYLGDRPAKKPAYSLLSLTPSFQRIRSGDRTAEIRIRSVNADNIGIAREENIP